ncbi:MAG TPA: hypothetical protein VFI45_07630 [Candidatus Acidoferrum sp.]|nr:hypothetical protein [Candidatus Acidoferrum sp.]
MNKLKLFAIFSTILRRAVLAIACLAFAGIASAAVPVVQGRWEFVVTSGDDPTTQLATMGQSIFSTYLLQTPGSPALTNITAFTTDTVACDTKSYNNITVANSSVDDAGNVVVDFTVTLDDGSSFDYVFTGVLAQGPPKVITGTYQRSAGGCTQGKLGTGTPDGNFTATWFPDLSGTWMGAFDAPDTGTGPLAVSASFTLTTNTDKTLSGTITILGSGLVNSSGVACIAPTGPSGPLTITLQPLAEGVSQSAGAGFELFGTDVNGTRVWVNAIATNTDGSVAAVGEDNPPGAPGTANDGTNNAYTAYYGISGGPCDGLGGGDAPFLLVTKTKKPSKTQGGQNGNGGQHGARGRNSFSLPSNNR